MFRTQKNENCRLYFTKPINRITSVVCDIPKNSLINIINPDTNEYYERNPYHPSYFKAKIIDWGEFDEKTVKAKEFYENQGNADVFLIIDTNRCIPEIIR